LQLFFCLSSSNKAAACQYQLKIGRLTVSFT